MKRIAVWLALVCATLAVSPPATAGPAPERLSRPHDPNNATFGSRLVDIYSNLGRAESDPRSASVDANAMKPLVCGEGVSASLTAVMTSRTIKAMRPDDRARLRRRDAESLTQLSIILLAGFDGVDADAVRADEARGPGVYHDAVGGLRYALALCQLFGTQP